MNDCALSRRLKGRPCEVTRSLNESVLNFPWLATPSTFRRFTARRPRAPEGRRSTAPPAGPSRYPGACRGRGPVRPSRCGPWAPRVSPTSRDGWAAACAARRRQPRAGRPRGCASGLQGKSSLVPLWAGSLFRGDSARWQCWGVHWELSVPSTAWEVKESLLNWLFKSKILKREVSQNYPAFQGMRPLLVWARFRCSFSREKFIL